MEEVLARAAMGFGIALTPENVMYCFIGVLLGTIIGVLPGIGPLAAIALLLPLTFDMNPTSAVIMLAGIYYGGSYGGSTTSILVNAPGESSSAVTCLDGFQMAKQGRAKAALATAAIGSFFAGTIATILLMLISPLVASFAIRFAPPEYFALMLLALTMVSALASGSIIKGLIPTLFGLLVATVGQDLQTGAMRFTFNTPELMMGVDFIAMALGLFAISEVLTAAATFKRIHPERTQVKGKYWITMRELRQSFPSYVRGTALGFFVGALPGAGGTPATFLSYGLEKKVSKHPEMFGKGAIEGVAGPEAANNAAHQGAMVPLLTLGIPGSGTTAVMLGAFTMYGIQPGPLLFENNPEFVWAIFASMYIGNAILLILNLPFVTLFAKLLDVPAALLYAMVLAFCTLGVYGIRLAIFDIGVMLVFGVIGYFMRKHDYPVAPALLAMVLGEMMEQSFRRALALSAGDPMIFFTRPMTVALLILTAISFFGPTIWGMVRARFINGSPKAAMVGD